MIARLGTRLGTSTTPDETFEITVDGHVVLAQAGESVAGAMLAAGVLQSRVSVHLGEPRGYFCGMGVCWECLVRIDGTYTERACMQRVRPGMQIETHTEQGP